MTNFRTRLRWIVLVAEVMVMENLTYMCTFPLRLIGTIG